MKILSLKKIFIILALSLSNLFVLTLLFTYFFGATNYKMFSRSLDSQSLKEKIQNQCGADFEKVIKGERKSFICLIKTKQKHKGADYEFRARFKVVKNKDKLRITNISGQLANGDKHLTEAKFCSGCFEDREFEDFSAGDFTEFMKEVSILAEDISLEAEQSSKDAFEDYNKKDRARAAARLKEKNCEGVWDKETESFQEFEESEDRLQCRLSQMDRQGNLKQVEDFYHKLLKKELWNLYGEGEEALLEETIPSFNDPYRYSLSVRASTALLENYTRWKEGFDNLESLRDKERFLLGISKDVNYFTGLMTKDQSQQDLYYLNEGFDGLYKVVNDSSLQIEKAKNEIPISTPIDYDAVSKEVEGLY